MGESAFGYYMFNFLNPAPESGISWKDLKNTYYAVYLETS